MPKGPTGTTQAHYLDYDNASLDQMTEFLTTDDLCNGELSPISADLETFSLSSISLDGRPDDRVEKIPMGVEKAAMIKEGCIWLQNLAHKYFLAGMALKMQSGSVPGPYNVGGASLDLKQEVATLKIIN